MCVTVCNMYVYDCAQTRLHVYDYMYICIIYICLCVTVRRRWSWSGHIGCWHKTRQQSRLRKNRIVVMHVIRGTA